MKKYSAKEDEFLKRVMADESKHGLKYRYMLLSRMKSDCDYYLNGHKSKNHLWAGDEGEQINAMQMLWDSFKPEQKPEWLTLEQLDTYKKAMCSN